MFNSKRLSLLGIVSICVLVTMFFLSTRDTAANLASNLTRCTENSGSINVSYAECNSLAYLYDETNGDGWSNHDNWFTNTDLSTWAGRGGLSSGAIQIAGGHVTKIIMFNNDLTGQIITGLNGLSYLEHVNLDSNSLSSINTSGLSLLTVFLVSNNNDLSLDFSHSTNIRHLDISTNNISQGEFSTILSPLSNLTNLSAYQNPITFLDLSSHSTLTGITASGMPTLTGVNLTSNTQLITAILGSNTGLSNIDLSQNTLLAQLDLSSNNFTGIDLSENTALISLDMHTNFLSEIDLSTNVLLEEVNLSDNEFSSLDLSDLTQLTHLHIANNLFTGIDISQNLLLEHFTLNDQEVNMNSLDLSHNTLLTTINAAGNGTYELIITGSTAYPAGNYKFLSNFLCDITDSNLIQFLADHTIPRDAKYHCPPKTFSASAGDSTAALSRSTPTNQGFGANFQGYTLTRTPDGPAPISMNSSTNSYTATGLTNGSGYTFTLCSTYNNLSANTPPCVQISATPAAPLVGGGPAKVTPRDNCPDGDTSPTPYDGLCKGISAGTEDAITPPADTTATGSQTGAIEPLPSMTGQKAIDVYTWAFGHRITTLSLAKVRLHNIILRYEAAKMIVQYILNAERKSLAPNPLCNIAKYKDYKLFDVEMRTNIRSICQLGLMGLTPDQKNLLTNFHPFEALSSDELTQILKQYFTDGPQNRMIGNQRVDLMNFLKSQSER